MTRTLLWYKRIKIQYVKPKLGVVYALAVSLPYLI